MLPIRLACTMFIIISSVSVPTFSAAVIRAKTQIIISAAFPNVALSKPPTDSDVLRAISSVALPIKNANGIIAIIEVMNERFSSC